MFELRQVEHKLIWD